MSNSTLQRRAVLAILLMVGFYTLALGISAILIYLPYAEWHYLDRIDFRLLFFCGAGALGILAAIFPRTEKFHPPGPELDSAQHPRLHQAIWETAAATGQAMPAHVYLVPDPNAWVAQHGGFMGVGGERVMGLGLPLLQTLSVAEFRAVLAHEFGHFHGGDTALGPWLYTTRAAIGRTLTNLAHRHGWLGKPFIWYGNAFLRITHAISRQQEFAADALAARVAGAAPLVSGLKTIHGVSPAFMPFWSSEFAPALEAGIRPPIVEGFRRFLAAPEVIRQTHAALERQLALEETDPYDTHPPLKDRVAALLPLVSDDPMVIGEPALTLLDNTDQVEDRLLSHLLKPEAHARLAAASWDDMADRVWLPRWREVVDQNRKRLAGLRPEELSAYAAQPASLAVRFQLAAEPLVASARHVAEAQHLAGAALAVVLRRQGFSISAPPGELVRARRGDLEFRPFAVLEELRAGTLTAEEWHRQCLSAGIEGGDLGAA